MATIPKLLIKAQNDEQIARLLMAHNVSACLEWAVIAFAYSAIHYIDAYLSHFHAKPDNHGDRHKYLQSVDRVLAPDYKVVFDEGRAARYTIYSIDLARLNTEIIPFFENVRDTVERSLNITTTP